MTQPIYTQPVYTEPTVCSRIGDAVVTVIKAPYICFERLFGHLGYKTIRFFGNLFTPRDVAVRAWGIPPFLASLVGVATLVGTIFATKTAFDYVQGLFDHANADWKLGKKWRAASEVAGGVAIISLVAFACIFTATGIVRGVLFSTL